LFRAVSGIDLDGPGALENVRRDSQRMRDKYHLPDANIRDNNPVAYIRLLEALIKGKNIPYYRFTSEEEMRKAFPTIPRLRTQYDDASRSIIVLEPQFESEYRDLNEAKGIEHEFIHALQHLSGDQSSNEQREYEAYIANV